MEDDIIRYRRTPLSVRQGRECLRRYTPNPIESSDIPCRFFAHANRKSAELWEVATSSKQHGHQRRWSTFNRLHASNFLDAVELQDGYIVYIPG